jgi:hypothetical protein
MLLVIAIAACSRDPDAARPSGASSADAAHPQDAQSQSATTSPGWIPASDQDLAAESAKALAGDADAASRVAGYYGFVKSGTALAQFWMQVAAENGDPGWMSLYGAQLAAMGGADTCRRGIYWLRRSAALRPASKTDVDHEIQEISQRPECSPVPG